MDDFQDLPVVPLHDRAFWADVHTPLRVARERSPLGVSDDGVPIVLRRQLLEEVIKDTAGFAIADKSLAYAGSTAGPIGNHWRYVMGNMNPPEHTRLRGLVARAFTPRTADEMRPLAASLADAAVDAAVELGSIDGHGELSAIPLRVVAHMLGVPESEQAWFAAAGLAVGNLFSFDLKTNEALLDTVSTALSDLSDYARALVRARRVDPRDDLLTAWVQARDGEDRLSEHELVNLIVNLLWAGVDTTQVSIPIALAVLAAHPEQFRKVRATPALAPTTVEEVLRFEPSVFNGMRVCVDDCTVGGIPMAAGQAILLNFVAADRDPRAFEEPDRFIADRGKVRTINFGAGIHHCIGAPLARATLQEVVRAMAERCRGIALASSPTWRPFSVLRHLEHVSVSIEPSRTSPALDH